MVFAHLERTRPTYTPDQQAALGANRNCRARVVGETKRTHVKHTARRLGAQGAARDLIAPADRGSGSE
ncbi:hypothetical protein [Rhodococcus koreensis]|uniref:hypothetical protein n=1 Tax=Rhodococcus koreensis TaxID=99653 RepID=UPI00197DACB2|nr:hypothetical protein [Rhodococcus koreensis]QSE84696.1 hypothetical protein JWS14_39090 [Rhodococcus koreensis]